MTLNLSFPAQVQNDKAHAIKQQHPNLHCHDGRPGAVMHSPVWMTYSATVCVYVCTAFQLKSNKLYNKQYSKSPDSTVRRDMPRVHVTDAAEIKQVSWRIEWKSNLTVIQCQQTHSGLRSAQSASNKQLQPLMIMYLLFGDLASFTHCHAFCIN